MKKILVIEDDLMIREMISDWLEGKFEMVEAQNGEEAIKKFSETQIDAVISDWMMPGLNGIEFTKHVREKFGNTPIVMISARTDDDSIEKAFNAGVSDFLKKPFSFKELETRLSRFITEDDTYQLDDVKNTLTCNDVTVSFTNKEYEVLKLLVKRLGDVLTKDEISIHAWGYPFDGTRNIDVTIHKIKGKVEPIGVKILTKRGQGYYIEKK